MASTVSMPLTSYPDDSSYNTYIEAEEVFAPSSVDWKNSITVPTRKITLPSFSATPDFLPEPTATSSSPKSDLLSTRSIICAAVITSVVICIATSVLLYRWCVKNRTKAPKASNISKPAVIQNGLSTWSLDSQAGLASTLSEEKRAELMEKGLPSWSPNNREAMSARVLTRAAEETSCGIKPSCSNETMISRSETGKSVSRGGKTAKQSQDIAYEAIAVSVGSPVHDQRGIDDVEHGALHAPLGSPERALVHGDEAGAVKLARLPNVVAKTPEPLGGRAYI
ncbi:hypothetical protein FS837_012229 [Tulasnella sp. UAMH 9824]|nr:hypothetical protein FS837_012229 [Tulasnella sp. UAMH 9824]